MAPTRAVTYSRVSTTSQAEDGHGLAAQEATLRAFVADHHLEVVAHVEDGGERGGSLDRPGWQRVMAMVDAGEVDMVVAVRSDRVARSLLQLLQVVAHFDQRGVRLRFTAEDFDSAPGSGGKLLMQIRGAVAEHESQLCRTRTREALAAARARGVRLGRPPCGWTIRRGVWEPSDRYPVVVRAHELRAAGLRYDDIAAQLQDEGIPTGSGRDSWSRGQVCRLLRSPLTPPAAPVAG